MKSEPNAYSFTDLMNEDEGAAEWDGVRNYQARNTMRDDMKVGDGVIFYHSNAKPPGAVGIAEIVREGYPDFTAWDPDSEHPDPKSTPDNPIWYMVDIKAVEEFKRFVPVARNQDDSRTRKYAACQELAAVCPAREQGRVGHRSSSRHARNSLLCTNAAANPMDRHLHYIR